jgi:outer membrane protein
LLTIYDVEVDVCDVTTGWSRRRWLAGLGSAVALSGHLVTGVPLAHAQGTPVSSEPAVGPQQSVPTVLTLDDALKLAAGASEQVDIAEAGVARAEGARQLARSARLPQLDGAASYDRTLKSEFEGLFDSTAAPCTPLQADPTAPLEARVAELERAYNCPPSSGLFGGGDDVDLPFGQANAYRLGLVFSQSLYSGGRIQAQERQARVRRDNARLGVTSAQAQTLLDVTEAFYDAAMADRLVQIAEQTYAQADRSLAQATAQREAGRVSEFELLRAQVARDTLQPSVVRARAGREIGYLRLRQLLELPLDAPLSLQAALEDPTLPPPSRFAPQIAEVEAGLPLRDRVTVTQTANEVQAAAQDVAVARSQRRPALSINSNYGLVTYPSTVPAFDDWRTNWTVGALVTVPILNGGRIRADVAIARAGVTEAEARLRLTRELAALDAESARQELRAAHAEWEASGATIQQAARAYDIAELRYREGLSTQLELSDSRLLLAESEVTRARAARDLQVRRVRLALLPDLPLSGSAFVAATAAGAASQPSALRQAPTGQQTPTGQSTIRTGGTTTGVRAQGGQ